MKLLHVYLLYLFSSISLLQADGFVAGTLVKTNSQYIPIELLTTDNTVISYKANNSTQECPIASTSNYTTHHCIRISVGNEYIYAAVDQKFYSYNQQKWVHADALPPTDLLMNCEGNPVTINAIEKINQQQTMYSLSTKTSHTFCVSSYNIVVHNMPHIVVPLFIYLGPVVTEIAQIGLAFGATVLGAHWAQKISKKHRREIAEVEQNSDANSGFGGGGGWQDPENDKEKHPHGIYEGSPYHHKNSSGQKSPPPKDGQRCLDYSLPTEGTQRIAIENDTIVILKYTSPGKYHGHLIKWKDLKDELQNILIKKGFVKKTGKIIKQITEKSLL